MSYILSRVIDHRHWQYRQWFAQASSAEVRRQADELAVRRDTVTLLTYVRDNKVVGTKTTGNLPLKAIREVTAGFVDPPVLDTSIGDHVFRLRTEYDIWPLYSLHVIAQIGELLRTPMAARWRLTPDGETFLAFQSLDQILHLLYVWWFRVNWAIAYPMLGIGETIPQDLPRVTLDRLRAMPVGRRVEFDGFADALAKRVDLIWRLPAYPEPQGYLRYAVRRMVIEVGVRFGVVDTETKEREPYMSPDLLAFRVTPFGRLLLTALDLLSGEAA